MVFITENIRIHEGDRGSALYRGTGLGKNMLFPIQLSGPFYQEDAPKHHSLANGCSAVFRYL